MLRLALCVTLTLAGVTTLVWGQASPPPQGQKPDPANPWSMWDIQQMIERATNEVTKRYNLTPEQTTFTRNLMATRVNAFLDQHEQKIRDIFGEIMRYQMGGQDPPADKVQQWTDTITPMFDEAKVQIVEGNREFREVLTDEQKKIHDIDLKVMEQNFTDAQKRLDRWQAGGFDPAKDMGRPAKPADGKPAAPAKQAAPVTPPAATGTPAVTQAPTGASKSTAVGPTADNGEHSMDYWEIYVRKFIENYKLDSAQSSRAFGILGETKKRADEYRSSRKSDYQKVQARLAADPKNTESHAQLKELDKPIDGLFNEMKLRLDQIPTDAQRKAYELASAQNKKASTTQAAGKAAASQATASRPATSRPARAVASRTVRSTRAQHSRPAASQPAAQR